MDKTYPILLVSAKDEDAAKKIINDIVDLPQDNSNESGNDSTSSQIWHIENKYYNVKVKLVSVVDGSDVPCAPELIEAHVIYLTENECDCEEVVSRRVWAGGEAEVRVVAAESARPPASALRAAARARYELVALREPPPPAAEPFPSPAGVARLREALQAHVWPGLRRHDLPSLPHTSDDSDSSDSERAAVARAEQFVEALGALGAARDLPRDLPRAQRREAAESVLDAFCRALGHRLHEL